MKQRSLNKTLIMRGMKVGHFIVAIGLFALCWTLFYRAIYATEAAHPMTDVIVTLFYAVAMFLFARVYDVYNIGYASITDNTYGQSLSALLSAALIYAVSVLMYMRLTNPLPLLGLCVVQTLWNALWTVWANHIYRRLHAPKKTVVIYRDRSDLRRLEEIRYMQFKFSIEGYIENPEDDYRQLEKRLEGYEAILVSGVNASLRNGIAKYCIEHGVNGYFAPHVGDVIMQGAHHMRSFSVPIFSVRSAEPTPEYLFIKRLFDILVSLAGLVVLAPLFILTALAIKLSDKGPVFSRQIRLTRHGRRFEILKFRSMRTDAEGDGVARLAAEDDDRITPVGKIIRACRLDELPQLINILRGDMSIVGPRPERPEIAAQYTEKMPAFVLRLQVKAGLTGFAQVYGKYNSNPYDKLQMDLMYINKMSLVEDLRLMFATVRVLFMKESTAGVSHGMINAGDDDAP